MQTTTFSAPKTLADTLLALTETYPDMTLDVGEDAAQYETHFVYTLWVPEGLEQAVRDAASQPLTFSAVEENVDYVARTRALFPPLQVGPYFIARNDEAAPEGSIPLNISPNRAFGSGEHATTTGCLLAYEQLLEEGLNFSTGLDFGAGSGILAIAAAKRKGTPFLALDNDAPSVDICAENAALNGVEALLTCGLADTPPAGPFDLIFANILLQPLLELAPNLAAALQKAPGAALILSGYTTEQGAELAARYRRLGLCNTWRHEQNGWLAEIWRSA